MGTSLVCHHLIGASHIVPPESLGSGRFRDRSMGRRSLKQFREELSLDVESAAMLLRVEPEHWKAGEDGDRAIASFLSKHTARILGMDYLEFASGAEIPPAIGVLFRAAVEAGSVYRAEFSQSGVAEFLGDVLRRVRVVAQIEDALQIHRPTLDVLAHRPSRSDENPAEVHALTARACLGVSPTAPIPSLCALLRAHGVLLLWRGDDDGAPDWLRGASFRGPIATIVAAAPRTLDVQGATRSRFTLAHELGHLLFDHYRGQSPAMYSPELGIHVRAFLDFDKIEDHADAFAACFLAPAGAVQTLVMGRNPTDEATIALVGRHFGIGREVSLNRLYHARCISQEDRDELGARGRHLFQRYSPAVQGDVPSTDELGINAGEVRRCVVLGVQGGVIGRAFAHDLLQIPYEESLGTPPNGVPIEPLWARWRVAMDRADRVMAMVSSSLTATRAEPLAAGGWRVHLSLNAGDPPECDEWIELDDHFEPSSASKPELLPLTQDA